MSEFSDTEEQWADTPDSFYTLSPELNPTPPRNQDKDWEPPHPKKKIKTNDKQAKASNSAYKNDSCTDSKVARRTSGRKKEAKGSAEISLNYDAEPSTSQAASPGSKSTKSGEGSPERSCAICLGPIDNKSFTDKCFHEFCFLCLDEWAKVKAVCPLCKQPFKKIIYNVRSLDDFDEKQVPSTEIVRPNRFRYRTTVTFGSNDNRDYFGRTRSRSRSSDLFGLVHRSVPPRRPYGTSSAFRKRVYAQSLRIKELRTTSGREPRNTNSSPGFYRVNPACTHRLVPWLNRELNMLLVNHTDHIMYVMDLILGLIKRFDIESAELAEHLRPFLGSRTSQFQHEFSWFARSPFDMATFDRHAVYESANPHLVESSTSTSSDDESLFTLDLFRPNRATSIHIPSLAHNNHTATRPDETARYLASCNIQPVFPLPNGWESPLPGPSGLSTLNTANNAVLLISSEDEDTVPYVELNQEDGTSVTGNVGDTSNHTSDTANEPITVESPSSSHSSDILCVAVEKPWEERSPILLISSEEEGVNNIRNDNTGRHNSSLYRKRKSDEGNIELSRRKQHKKSKKRRHATPPHQYRHRVRSGSRSPLNAEKERHRYRERHRHRRSRSRSRSTDIHVYVSSRHRSRDGSSASESYRHRKHKHKKHKKHKDKCSREERQRRDKEKHRKDREEFYRRCESGHRSRHETKSTRERTDKFHSSNELQKPLEEVRIPDSNITLCKTSNGYCVRDVEYSPQGNIMYSPLPSPHSSKPSPSKVRQNSQSNSESTNHMTLKSHILASLKQKSSHSHVHLSPKNNVTETVENIDTDDPSLLRLTFKKHPTGHKTSKPKKNLETIVWQIKNGQHSETGKIDSSSVSPCSSSSFVSPLYSGMSSTSSTAGASTAGSEIASSIVASSGDQNVGTTESPEVLSPARPRVSFAMSKSFNAKMLDPVDDND